MVGRRGSSQATPPDRAALLRERQELLRRLREVDQQLIQPRETAVIEPPERT